MPVFPFIDETKNRYIDTKMENENYTGDYEDGFFEGRGTFKFPEDQGRYEGEFRRGQFHGEGTLFVKGGSFKVCLVR